MFNYRSSENRDACRFRDGRVVYILGVVIGYLAQITSLSGAASLLFFDRSAGEFFVFGLTFTALVAITLMFWFIRRTQITLAGISTLAGFAVKVGLILVLFSNTVIEEAAILWSILSGLLILDAFPFLALTILLFRGGDRSETPV